MYKALYLTLRSYWRDYGGFTEIFSSPFFHFSLIIAGLHQLGIIDFKWHDLAIDSLPTILGFSLAAYAITFTLMGSALHRALSRSIDKKSGLPLIVIVNATFFHVIMFQALSLVYTITTSGTFFWKILGGHPSFETKSGATLWILVYGGEFVGCLLSVYSIFLLFSVSIAMFRLGRLTGQASSQKAANSNEIHPSEIPVISRDITASLRFKFVRAVAKILRIYV